MPDDFDGRPLVLALLCSIVAGAVGFALGVMVG
jgi:hypothetical protein